MSEPQKPKKLTLYTIGYQGFTNITDFANVLLSAGVQVLVDVRTYPFSRWNALFNREELSVQLPQFNIEYLWKGQSLGGKTAPIKPVGYDEGIEWLAKLCQSKTVVVMCMEADPTRCHRQSWISTDILKKTIPVVHLSKSLVSNQPKTSTSLSAFF